MLGSVTYLLPLRSRLPAGEELTEYLRALTTVCRVIVVDGSEADVFAETHRRLPRQVTHVPPRPDLRCANGKVHGVLTGLQLVETDLVVIADDDVRYSSPGLAAVANALDTAAVVVPQNYFAPMPWHARWDTARTLINRVCGGDFPGTLGVRMAVLRQTGGYDGDVLFENLELIRTVEAVGGAIRRMPDLYVRRFPPTTHHFLRQRVRQAYDELARPVRLLAWMTVLPLVLLPGRRGARLLLLAAVSTLAAEVGRRRQGGRAWFPATCSLFAPAWVLERSVCVWLSLLARARGGVDYGQSRLVRAANPPRHLRRALAASLVAAPSAG